MQTRWNASEELSLRDRITGGDREAARLLFERHFPALYEFVHYRVGRDREAAEDVVQDTFVVALERIASFDGRSSLHAWLCGIARNKLSEARRKRRPRRLEDVLAESDEDIFRILAALESEPLPDWVLEREETGEMVGATLSSLPPHYRDALVAKYVEGRSTAELARARGQGEKAAESQLHRARAAFSKVFQLLNRKRGGLA